MVKGVFVRLSFDAIRISQIQRQVKNKAMQNASWGVLYTDLIGFNRILDCCQRVYPIYLHSRGAFSVTRFDLSGNAKALTSGTSNRIGSALFRMYASHLLTILGLSTAVISARCGFIPQYNYTGLPHQQSLRCRPDSGRQDSFHHLQALYCLISNCRSQQHRRSLSSSLR